MIVIDTSVVLKWFLPSEMLADGAMKLRAAHEVGSQPCACPALLFYEAANALVTKSHVSLEQTLEALAELLSTDLLTYPFGEGDYPFAMRLAREHDISVYDASYVALARQLQCEFVTADLKLHRQLRHLKWVRLLE